jgi:hypothetical protein
MKGEGKREDETNNSGLMNEAFSVNLVKQVCGCRSLNDKQSECWMQRLFASPPLVRLFVIGGAEEGSSR